MNNNNFFLVFLMVCSTLMACERAYTPELATVEPDIVVEGYIEASDRALPPYVLLTKSANFFKTFDPSKLSEFIVRGAFVTITDGQMTDTLPQFCLNSLTPQQRQLVSGLLGFDADSLSGIDLCVYINPFGKIRPKEGGSYTLTVKAEGKTLTSTTTIPKAVGLDSIIFIPTPNNVIDSMVQMRGYISDPAGVKNFYRAMFSFDGGRSYITSTNSAVNDNFFNGKPSFQFPLSKPLRPNQEDYDFSTAGFYNKGEKVTIRYMTIDEAHYDFWNTAAQSAQNVGPFSTYTRIRSNIKGGIGIWGGFSAKYYDVEAPK
jgi:hypothetical protein